MILVKYNPAHTCIHHRGKEQKVTGALMEPDGWKLFLQLTFSGAEEPRELPDDGLISAIE